MVSEGMEHPRITEENPFDLGVTTWAMLRRRCQRRRYRNREVIFHAGEAADYAVIVEHGLVFEQSLAASGTPATVGAYFPNDVAGSESLIDHGSHRHLTAMAVGDTYCLLLNPEVAREFTEVHHQIQRWVTRELLEDRARLQRQLSDAFHVRAEIRVARTLADLVSRLHRRGRPLVLPLTHDDIAGLTGVTRPTASTILSELGKDGIVRTNRGSIAVEAPHRLLTWRQEGGAPGSPPAPWYAA
jgi:CRP-like cAMP-binding protein